MGFKYGRKPAVSKARLLEFYGIRLLRDKNMARFVSLSANNELDKPYFRQNLLEIDP